MARSGAAAEGGDEDDGGVPSKAATPWRVGDVLKGRYVVEEEVAHGAMGSIWRALDRDLERPVAVKVPSSECLGDAEFRERFHREVQRLIRLEHPHIVRLYDVGEHARYPFAVVAFLEGGTLADRVARRGTGTPRRLPTSDLTTWLRPVADALDFIHVRGVVHRDVKPANVLFDATGNPYLADFGLAKARGQEQSLTPAEHTVGTAAYLAPECVLEDRLSPAFDQYSLATTVFEVVTGVLPFSGGDLGTMLQRRLKEDAPRADAVAPDARLATGLVGAVARGLAREPSQRHRSCGDFARAVLAGA